MTNFRSNLSVILLALLDIVIVNVGFALAFWLRYDITFLVKFKLVRTNLDPYINLIPWLSVLSLVVFYLFDLYSGWRRKRLYNLIFSVVLSVLVITAFTMILTFWYRGFAFPRSVILIALFTQILLLAVVRSTLWLIARKFFGSRKVLIVGQSIEDGVIIANKFIEHSIGWFDVKGFLPFSEWQDKVGKINECDVVLISPALAKQQKSEIISYCTRHGKEALLVPELYELFVLGSDPQHISDMLVFSITPPKLNPGQLFAKRLFDIITALCFIILLSPVLILLCILIPVTSKGPVLYKQERLGRNGKKYFIYKFRSMVQDAEKLSGPVLASSLDPRITKIGRFIRATRLDEIPQFFNVLKGDMSLVGPRPERDHFIRQFVAVIPDYSSRMLVKPGITGLAQVFGNYSSSVEDKLRFDLMYIRNYSFALDIKIMLQTIRVVLQREQAEGVKEANNAFKKKLMNELGYKETSSTLE
ncbi:sugar transferase [Paenibacillus sp. HJGM_3]|uniref:sugar transferase n=1 Tax=Paenibacillus sp. HJGM_3 TaxID=3379816 RepID=UPI00385B04E8